MSEITIKLVDENTDLSHIYPYNWDCDIKGRKYFVCRIPGYFHCIGGRYGNNDLWAYPRNEKPSYENLIEFNAEPVRWGFIAKSNNYIKSKYDETEVHHTNSVTITRNDEPFYTIGCRDLFYGVAKAQVLIEEIQEHPLEFNCIDYDKNMIGRKIMYKDEPAIITDYCKGQCAIIIEPRDDADKSKFYYEGEYFVKGDALVGDGLWWFEKDDEADF